MTMTAIITSVTFSKQNTPGGHRFTIYNNSNNSNNAKRLRVSIIIGRYLFFVLLLGILLGASWSSESLEHICNALDATTSSNLFHESLRGFQ